MLTVDYFCVSDPDLIFCISVADSTSDDSGNKQMIG